MYCAEPPTTLFNVYIAKGSFATLLTSKFPTEFFFFFPYLISQYELNMKMSNPGTDYMMINKLNDDDDEIK